MIEAFEGQVFVFDGPEDYHARIDDPALGIDERSILVIRGAGPIGYPGGAEVVNMRPPAALIRAGVDALPCLGDGRQSGASGSPRSSTPAEAAVGGGLAILRDGDRIRVDLKTRSVNLLVSDAELAERRAALAAEPFRFPEDQTPWQALSRRLPGSSPVAR
jgi:dihydroxy-acid dehydratase